MELTGNVDAVLVAVDSPLAAKVQLHSMNMDGGVMRMRALEKIELPAGKTVKLAPGGLHVMLYDIKQPLEAGGTVPLTLTFMGAGGAKSTLKLDAQVRSAEASPGTLHRH
jgi:copper(I)-binding protein